MLQSTKFLVGPIQGFPQGGDQFLAVQLALSSVIPSLLVVNVSQMLLWRNLIQQITQCGHDAFQTEAQNIKKREKNKSRGMSTLRMST